MAAGTLCKINRLLWENTNEFDAHVHTVSRSPSVHVRLRGYKCVYVYLKLVNVYVWLSKSKKVLICGNVLKQNTDGSNSEKKGFNLRNIRPGRIRVRISILCGMHALSYINATSEFSVCMYVCMHVCMYVC